MRFRDRRDAGRRLARRLQELRPERPVVVALPRGGVPVAAEVAEVLDAPLDVLVVRKLGHPLQPELAIGAIGEAGAMVLDRELLDRLRVDEAELRRIVAREERELARRVRDYRGDRPPIPVADRTVVLVDDGIATGSTARAAIQVLRQAGVRRLVLAVPVAAREAVRELGTLAEVVCLESPPEFHSVGQWYDDFGQTTDAEVLRILDRTHRARSQGDHGPGGGEVVVGVHRLPGTLVVPDGCEALVLFAHGSGSSRSSPRNRFVAERLNRAGLGTLLFDLLTPTEAADRRNVFDVELLGRRLVEATAWCRTRRLPPSMGYFGASTGAGAALVAAALLGADVGAVVSRGGRPDLAGEWLGAVLAPTLLVVGSRDPSVVELNRQAATRLTACEHRVVVVPGATHLFEEPGTLEQAADLAAEWFATHLLDRSGSPGLRAVDHGIGA